MKNGKNILACCERARNICIVKTLAKLGHFPTRTSEKEAWFLSPLRSETQASFNVSVVKNLWYDFGMGKGGSTIDLIMAIKSCDLIDALEFLSEDIITYSLKPRLKEPSINEKIKISTVEPLNLPALLNYLESRKIPLEIGRKYCRQIWYRSNGKQFFTIGLQNQKGGWELRNKYYKNSSSPKTYSLFERGSKQLLIIEGMFDFLSLAAIDEDLVESSDCIILNSLAFIDRIKDMIPKYEIVLLYLDNDPAGKKAASSLLSLFDNITDCSDCYSGYKDLNEKLKNENPGKNKQLSGVKTKARKC
ncbi:toprim domain-containing protein [Antarcticibacterium sp. 1MA-6-2]|uniref:toprim domain-containing protein n=1 Tax=Antarcticibacterium sp. 1MA-6-2 TaxID=2908210 RepID=UPI001F1B987D|nr:toprim domain-containing protein [Antarcticibacterium sp. 1MA-6-2]UJH90119.1 toprim domain-containing protein [Antarcticibacterium sp. 1MA-6-2]